MFSKNADARALGSRIAVRLCLRRSRRMLGGCSRARRSLRRRSCEGVRRSVRYALMVRLAEGRGSLYIGGPHVAAGTGRGSLYIGGHFINSLETFVESFASHPPAGRAGMWQSTLHPPCTLPFMLPLHPALAPWPSLPIVLYAH